MAMISSINAINDAIPKIQFKKCFITIAKDSQSAQIK